MTGVQTCALPIYNGHFGGTCYHPRFCFYQFGDLERALLRQGHSTNDWHSVFKPVVARYREADIGRCFRGEAVLANPDIYLSSKRKTTCMQFVYSLTRTYSPPLSLC